VFVLCRCINYRLYTAKSLALFCRFVHWTRTAEDVEEALNIFITSNTIFWITTLLFMYDGFQVDSSLMEILKLTLIIGCKAGHYNVTVNSKAAIVKKYTCSACDSL
jgi:hypothetical protein